MPHTVLHVLQPTEAGVPTVVKALVRDQVSAGWQVHVACPTGPGDAHTELRNLGASIHPWMATRNPGPGLLREYGQLRAIIKATRPHIVHLHSSKAGLVGRLTIRGRIPTVFTPHAWSFDAAEGVLAATSLAWERFGARWANRIVAVSQAERSAGERLKIHGSFETIPNGVDLERFAPRDRQTARESLGLSDEPLAVCVGRLCEQKGQDALLGVWPLVADSVIGAQLALVGDGPTRDLLSKQVSQLAGVRMVGSATDPRNWYAAADVVVVPSRWEGMALVPLEAMAMERFVIGTEVAGMAETVGRAGADLVPVGDAQALAKALAHRLSDRTKTDQSARPFAAFIRHEHNASSSAASVRAVYCEILLER